MAATPQQQTAAAMLRLCLDQCRHVGIAMLPGAGSVIVVARDGRRWREIDRLALPEIPAPAVIAKDCP